MKFPVLADNATTLIATFLLVNGLCPALEMNLQQCKLRYWPRYMP